MAKPRMTSFPTTQEQKLLSLDPMSSNRILVVDDDPETTEFLRFILEISAFQVLTCPFGSEAIDLARKSSPDVVLIDLIMPDMAGLEVCRQVRQFSDVPILVLSTNGKPGMLEQALNEGADDFLIKPIHKDILVAHLNKLIRRARAEKEATWRSRDHIRTS